MATNRPPGKTRITIRLDTEVIAWFRQEVRSSEGSYQTAINAALRDYIAREPLEATLRRVVREELARTSGAPPGTGYAYGLPTAMVADADDSGSEYGGAAKPKRRVRRRRRSRPAPRSARPTKD